jgi:hypothetical protein
MFLKAEDSSKEFKNSRCCSRGTNGITNLSEIILSTFYKHVIVVNLNYSGCILELGAKFSLLYLCTASIMIELDVNASNNCK